MNFRTFFQLFCILYVPVSDGPMASNAVLQVPAAETNDRQVFQEHVDTLHIIPTIAFRDSQHHSYSIKNELVDVKKIQNSGAAIGNKSGKLKEREDLLDLEEPQIELRDTYAHYSNNRNKRQFNRKKQDPELIRSFAYGAAHLAYSYSTDSPSETIRKFVPKRQRLGGSRGAARLTVSSKHNPGGYAFHSALSDSSSGRVRGLNYPLPPPHGVSFTQHLVAPHGHTILLMLDQVGYVADPGEKCPGVSKNNHTKSFFS